MPLPLPAISLVAVPGRRRQTLDIAREIERRGFSGIYMPSRYGNMAQCTGLALATERIRFGTAIAPIYAQTTEEFAAGAAYIHEVSGGRFRFGIGVAHGPMHQRLGITPGKPLGDTRAFVEKLRSYDGIGALPPLVLAALRKRMVALAAEIADGVLFANASLSHLAASLMGRPISGSASPPASRWRIPAPLSRSSNPMTALAPCRRSCSPHCASGWSHSPPRSPTACCSPMPACHI